MLVIIIGIGGLIINKKFMMYLITNADLVPRTDADRVEDADDNPNNASLLPIGEVGCST